MPAYATATAKTASPDDEALLWRYARSRHEADLDRLVRRYRPLAHRLAHRYRHTGHPVEDLEQVSCLGLIKALKRFDPQVGHSFTAYAIPTIVGECRRMCRDNGWFAHMPRGMQERVSRLSRTREELTGGTGRTPTVDDLAGALGWSHEDVVSALLAESSRSVAPFDGAPANDSDEGPAAPCDTLGEVDDGFELVEDLAAIESALPALSATEKKVLRLSFGDELPTREIASRLGMTDGQVVRMLGKSLHSLSSSIEAPPGSPTAHRPMRDRRTASRPARARPMPASTSEAMAV